MAPGPCRRLGAGSRRHRHPRAQAPTHFFLLGVICWGGGVSLPNRKFMSCAQPVPVSCIKTRRHHGWTCSPNYGAGLFLETPQERTLEPRRAAPQGTGHLETRIPAGGIPAPPFYFRQGPGLVICKAGVSPTWLGPGEANGVEPEKHGASRGSCSQHPLAPTGEYLRRGFALPLGGARLPRGALSTVAPF